MYKIIIARINSFKYALKGILDLFKSQPNAKIHFVAMFIVITLGFYLKVSNYEWLILILTISSVLAAEAFNTALEYLTDLVSPDYHPLAGKTKDVAAGGVLITAIGAVIIACLVFFPKLCTIFCHN